MPAARIIPCLDVRDGRVVKGVRFREHRDAGDIVDLARRYRDEGADELVFYDITASAEGRSLDFSWVERLSKLLDIPFCVAGGIRDVGAARRCLEAGADKISINSPAIERPHLISELAAAFGSQFVVLGVDSFEEDGEYFVKQYTGSAATTRDTGLKTIEWVKKAELLGAGEIVLNCMNRDGVRQGYDLSHTRAVAEAVSLPVIASGGAGNARHFLDILSAGASGALAASVFHDGLLSIPKLKEYLALSGIEVRR